MIKIRSEWSQGKGREIRQRAWLRNWWFFAKTFRNHNSKLVILIDVIPR